MRIGIDLLWVRVGICGGTESYIRNLLDGFAKYDPKNEYVLFVAKDHAHSFWKYAKAAHMRLQACHVESKNRVKCILWENRYLDTAAARCRVDVMLVPVYSKPSAHVSSAAYVSVIHDFQALHYPEYFSPVKRLFLNYSWKRTMQTSDRLVTISDAVRRDLTAYFPSAAAKAVTIYNPVITRHSGIPADVIERRYGIRRMEYFYCVSSMLPHKNLDTILRVVKELPETCLVISGVGKGQGLQRRLRMYQIQDKVVLTGFVPDKIRDCLYENCRLFLFPSVFEGFGMPPVEAMRRGKRVVMARCACLEEVTKRRAVYVEEPYSVAEWKEKIQYALTLPEEKIPFPEYSLHEIVRQYAHLFASLAGGKGYEDCRRRSSQQVYEKIYDTVSANYLRAGKKLDYEKKAFLCNVGTHPQVVDAACCKGLSNPEFYQAVHMAVYHRLPEQKEYKKWSAYFGMDASAFQRKVLKKLSASSVAAINQVHFIHHPRFRQHRGICYWGFGVLYGLTDKQELRRIGKKLPAPVQKIIRKVFI